MSAEGANGCKLTPVGDAGSSPVQGTIMEAAYGISRTRDRKGAIIKQTTLPWVNCIHTNVGGGWKTMEVLILEVYDKGDSACGR